jgi:hypothetical protein
MGINFKGSLKIIRKMGMEYFGIKMIRYCIGERGKMISILGIVRVRVKSDVGNFR